MQSLRCIHGIICLWMIYLFIRLSICLSINQIKKRKAIFGYKKGPLKGFRIVLKRMVGTLFRNMNVKIKFTATVWPLIDMSHKKIQICDSERALKGSKMALKRSWCTILQYRCKNWVQNIFFIQIWYIAWKKKPKIFIFTKRPLSRT